MTAFSLFSSPSDLYGMHRDCVRFDVVLWSRRLFMEARIFTRVNEGRGQVVFSIFKSYLECGSFAQLSKRVTYEKFLDKKDALFQIYDIKGTHRTTSSKSVNASYSNNITSLLRCCVLLHQLIEIIQESLQVCKALFFYPTCFARFPRMLENLYDLLTLRRREFFT